MEHRLLALGAALEALPDPFFCFDQSDRLVSLNAAAIELAGNINNGTVEMVIAAILKNRSDHLTEGALEKSYQHPGGGPSRIAIAGNAYDVRTQAGSDGKVLMLRKVGKTDKAPLDSDEALLEQGRVSFLSSMSHDLRTPLNSIIGFAEIISMNTLGNKAAPRYREYATDIVEEAYKLHETIDALITLASLESGDFELRPETIDPTQVLGQSVEAIATSHPDVEFEVRGPENRVLIRGDSDLLHKAFTAILVEMLRLAPKSSKTLHIRVENRPGAISFSFSADAVDIELVNGAVQPKTGLWIGHTIAAAHGGGLRFTQVKPSGSCIRLVLPVE